MSEDVRIYMAAVHTNQYKDPESGRYLHLTENERQIVNHNLPNILESYHYIHKQKFVDNIRRSGDKVFLDSGAFSAFSLGVKIDLPTYCRYIQENIDIIRNEDGVVMASVLDGIGDAQQTLDNQLLMEKLGAKPLPCFHFGEDPKFLEYYIANYDYITIGGLVPESTVSCQRWLDRIWDKYLTDGAGRSKIRCHAFGVTSIQLMERYPWYSVDSSSWIQAAAFGSVITPDHGPMSVSEKSPSLHDYGQHVGNLRPLEQEHVFQMFMNQGFSYERLSQIYESRAVYNLNAFQIIMNNINANKKDHFRGQIQELF